MSTTNLDNRKPTEPLDILIVGAGPVGLTTALGALHRGINNIAVYDQTSAFSKAGRFIDLMPNGINAVKQVNPKIYDAILETFRPPGRNEIVGYVNTSGHTTPSRNVQAFGNVASLPWWKLQDYMLQLIPSQLIHINHHLVDIQDDEERGVTIVKFVKNRKRRNQFKNWIENARDESLPEHTAPEEEVSITAKLVIGADGINSVARRIIYKGSHPGLEEHALPCYSGMSSIWMAGNLTLPPKLEAKLNKTFLKRQMSLISVDSERRKHDSTQLILVRNTQPNALLTYFFIFYVPIEEEQALSCSKKDIFLKAQRIAKEHGYPSELIELSNEIFKAAGENGILVRPLYIVPVSNPPNFERLPLGTKVFLPDGIDRPWFHGRSILVGDALHGSPPFRSQGTSMGIEDALVLMELLVKHNVFNSSIDKKEQYEALQSVFDHYKHIREPRLQHFQKNTLNGPTIWEEEEFGLMMNEMLSFVYQT